MLLKQVIQALINDQPEQARAVIHEYIVNKTQDIVRVQEIITPMTSTEAEDSIGWHNGVIVHLSTLPTQESKMSAVPDNFQNVIRAIPKQPQRQDGTNDQLRDLIPFAIRLGLYDAADLMKSMVARTDTAIKAAS